MTARARLRLFRFSLVGAIGIAVQLGMLAALVAMKMNYLLATGLAVEAAVLHNFLWHQRYTWADRAGSTVALSSQQRLNLHRRQSRVNALAGRMVAFARAARQPRNHLSMLRGQLHGK